MLRDIMLLAVGLGVVLAVGAVVMACLFPLIDSRPTFRDDDPPHWTKEIFPTDPNDLPCQPTPAPDPDFTGSPFTESAGKPAGSAPAATPRPETPRQTSAAPKSKRAASSTAPASSPPSAVADELPIELLGGPVDGARLVVHPDFTRVIAPWPAGPALYARTCSQTREGRTIFRHSGMPMSESLS